MSDMELIPCLTEASFKAHDFGVEIEGNPSFKECYQFLAGMVRVKNATPWIIGDVLNWAEARFGEDWPQLLAVFPQYESETIRVYMWVASKVAPVIRITSQLSFSHHVVVAAKKPSEQTRLLQLATHDDPDKRWTVSKLRRHIREERNGVQERLYSLRITRPEIDSLEFVLTEWLGKESESEQADVDILSVRSKARELLNT